MTKKSTTSLPLLTLAVGDPYLTQNCLQKKKHQILSSGEEDSVFLYYMKDIDWEVVLRQALTYPFLSEKQIIWIKGAELMKEGDFEMLKKYFKNPSHFSFIFLEGEIVKGKKKIYTFVDSVKGESNVLDAPPNKGSSSRWSNRKEQIRLFIREKIRSLNLKVSPGAAKILEETCSDNLLFLNSTLEKLSLNVPADEIISEAHVEALGDQVYDSTGFDLAEALSKKNITEVFEIYFHLYEENPYQSTELLGLLNWQMKRIYEGKKFLLSGGSRDELGRKLNIRPYFLNRFVQQLSSFNEQKLKRTFKLLFETDAAIKTGKVSVKAAVEMLLLRLGTS